MDAYFFFCRRHVRRDVTTNQTPSLNQSNQETMTTIPHQSKGPLVRFPGSTTAAAELGVTRGHLHRVLIGERQSPPLLARWNAWLKRNPQFANIQPRR